MEVPPLLTVPKVYPLGTSSLITIMVAVFGPAFVTVNSKITVSPIFGVLLAQRVRNRTLLRWWLLRRLVVLKRQSK